MQKKRNLLLIDDDHLYARALSMRLEHAGFSVTLLRQEEINSVLEIIEKNKIELILLDLIMPRVDGREVLRLIRSKFERPVLPVIIVSGMDDSADVSQTFALGANDYMTKPIPIDIAIARIQAHLSRVDLDRELLKKKELEVLSAMVVTYCHELASPLCVLTLDMSRFESSHPQIFKENLERSQKALQNMEAIIRRIREAGEQPEVFFENYTGSTKMVKVK